MLLPTTTDAHVEVVPDQRGQSIFLPGMRLERACTPLLTGPDSLKVEELLDLGLGASCLGAGFLAAALAGAPFLGGAGTATSFLTSPYDGAWTFWELLSTCNRAKWGSMASVQQAILKCTLLCSVLMLFNRTPGHEAASRDGWTRQINSSSTTP